MAIERRDHRSYLRVERDDDGVSHCTWCGAVVRDGLQHIRWHLGEIRRLEALAEGRAPQFPYTTSGAIDELPPLEVVREREKVVVRLRESGDDVQTSATTEETISDE